MKRPAATQVQVSHTGALQTIARPAAGQARGNIAMTFNSSIETARVSRLCAGTDSLHKLQKSGCN